MIVWSVSLSLFFVSGLQITYIPKPVQVVFHRCILTLDDVGLRRRRTSSRFLCSLVYVIHIIIYLPVATTALTLRNRVH